MAALLTKETLITKLGTLIDDPVISDEAKQVLATARRELQDRDKPDDPLSIRRMRSGLSKIGKSKPLPAPLVQLMGELIRSSKNLGLSLIFGW